MSPFPSARRMVHPRDLHTHLERAASRGARATVEADGTTRVARFVALSLDALVLEPDPGEGAPDVGGPVGVAYGWENLSYFFASRVLLGPVGKIRLALPDAVDVRDRRAHPRFAVPQGLVFAAPDLGDAPLRVHDVSEGGLALALPVGMRLPTAHHLLMGALVRPDGRDIPMDLEIRNARPGADGKRLVLGTRLAAITPLHRGWYADVVRQASVLAA